MKIELFVFDTNALVSAFLFDGPKPAVAYERATKLGKLVASTETHSEFAQVFSRPKFDRYVPFRIRFGIINRLTEEFTFVQPTESITACRDPKDDKFLSLAVAANAACIVSGDDYLLVLHPFRNIPILNPTSFLDRFQ